MKTNTRRIVYGLAALTLLGVLIAGPRAWAVPARDYLGQGGTLPTRTPTRPFVPTEVPTVPPAPPKPRATEAPPAAPPAPGETATLAPTAPSAPAAVLALSKTVDRLEAWPGATVRFTVTLANAGAGSARQVVIEDVLPMGLEPGQIITSGAAWAGRTLRARVPVLAPGGRIVVTFTALVRADAAGVVIINRATATAAGGLNANASAVMGLPPVELPPTGAHRFMQPR